MRFVQCLKSLDITEGSRFDPQNYATWLLRPANAMLGVGRGIADCLSAFSTCRLIRSSGILSNVNSPHSLLLLPFLGVHVDQVLVPAGSLPFSRLGTSPPSLFWEDVCSKQ